MPDPRTAEPKPPFRPQSQQPPGLSSEMTPQPDHGERSYRGKGLLKDKVALITGADSGIGRAVAIAFAREGADIAISYLNEEGDARETARWVEESGRRAILLPGDICDESHCKSLVEKTVSGLGRLDILVNNAATQQVHERLDEFTTADLEQTYRTNVFAMFHLCKAAAPHMKPGSAIVNTTSVNAKSPEAELLIYASTKGAIATFTVALAESLAKQGIRVNCVAPGPVWTPLQPGTKPAEQIKQLGAGTLMERPGQPAEIAPAFVLLASDEGRFMTGALVPVTGGKPML